jgi:hypothetical protein
MKDKNSKNSQKKSASVQLLVTTGNLNSEAADENLFEFIKKNNPEIQANSLNVFNFYVYGDSENNVLKCIKSIAQGIASTTKYEALVVCTRYDPSDDIAIITKFKSFPFNLDEIKKVSKFIGGVANKTGCRYDSWEIGIPDSKKSK